MTDIWTPTSVPDRRNRLYDFDPRRFLEKIRFFCGLCLRQMARC